MVTLTKFCFQKLWKTGKKMELTSLELFILPDFIAKLPLPSRNRAEVGPRMVTKVTVECM